MKALKKILLIITFILNSVLYDSVGYSEVGQYIDSFEAAGTMPRGLAFDGVYLWNSDEAFDRIYKMDKTGGIIDYLESPGPNPKGLAYGGGFLWHTDSSTDLIYQIDAKSGEILAEFDSPGPHPRGLAHDGESLWITDDFENIIYQLDTSGLILDFFTSPGINPKGLTFDGTFLWNVDSQSDRIYKLTIEGEVLDELIAPDIDPRGLTHDGVYLWNSDSRNDMIYKIDLGITPDTPTAVIRANNSINSLSVNSNESVSVSIELNPGLFGGEFADWWLIKFDHQENSLYYFDAFSFKWQKIELAVAPTYQGALMMVEPLTIETTSELSEGAYDFYFGVDLEMNGIIDAEVFYDKITVEVLSVSTDVQAFFESDSFQTIISAEIVEREVLSELV